MKKSGLNKSHKFSGTDISLIIILAFCSLVLVFIGYSCCRRRRSKGKKKAAQRKIAKGRSNHKNGEVLGTSQQSDESLDPEGQDSNTTGHPSFEENPKNNKKHFPTSSKNPNDRSFLSRIMSSLRRGGSTPDSDAEASGKSDSKGASTSKQDSPSTRRGNSKKANSSLERGNKQESEVPGNSKSGKTDKDLKNGRLPQSNSSIVKSTRNPTDVDPLKSETKTGQLPGICRDKGEGGKGKKSSSKVAKKCDCTRNCTGSACRKCCGVIDDGDDGDNYEVLTSSRTDQGNCSSKHGKQHHETRNEARKDEGRSRSDKESEVVASQTRSEANPWRKSGKTVKAGIQGSLDNDESYVMDVYKQYDMCREFDNDKAKRITPMDVDEEYVSKEIADAVESDVHTREEMDSFNRRDKQDKPTMPRNEASLGQYVNASGGMNKRLKEEKRIESIGETFNVIKYARKEWKSDTATAQAVREGYFQIPQQLGLNNLRVIRGDNYCAIRATLFQVLAKKIPILSQLGKIEEIPQELTDSRIDWIDDWNFASRFTVERNKVCDEIKVCLKELSNLVDLNAQMCHEEGRVTHLLSNFNFKPLEFEIRLLEAVKFLMLYRAIQLHRKIKANGDVPIFAMIMFARDSSQDPWHFMSKHLNAVGDTGGLEQVEMHLLGYTLGVTIKVVRPSHFGQSDFIASYPDDMPDGTPVVTLVAEDDRHYNILS